MAELATHIPGRGEQTVRYLGFVSNRSRGERKKLEATRTAPPASGPEDDNPPPAETGGPLSRKAYRLAWAALLKKVYNVDAMRCSRCGGDMRIITAVERPDVISRILRHLDISTRARAPTAHRCEERDPALRAPGGGLPGQETLEAPDWDAFAADPPFADDVAPDPDPGWPEDALPPDED